MTNSAAARLLRAFPPNERYLVGVSGGRDSVALLHWLLAQGYGRLIVCHFEHGLRGRASRGDARFVTRLSKKLGLPFVGSAAAIEQIAREKMLSVETAARQERMKFFAQVARRRRCPVIFLGHHADDQVETFLLQLLRGAGGRGLGAMREVSQHGPLQIVRPLLAVWRTEVDAYVAEQRLKYRDDASNETSGPRRNRLRHQIIPRLEKEFGKRVRANLWRAASILAEEDALLDSLLPNESVSGETLGVKELRALPIPLQRRVLRRWLQANEVAEVGFKLIENVRALLAPEAKSARTNLPRDRFVRRRAGKIFLE